MKTNILLSAMKTYLMMGNYKKILRLTLWALAFFMLIAGFSMVANAATPRDQESDMKLCDSLETKVRGLQEALSSLYQKASTLEMKKAAILSRATAQKIRLQTSLENEHATLFEAYRQQSGLDPMVKPSNIIAKKAWSRMNSRCLDLFLDCSKKCHIIESGTNNEVASLNAEISDYLYRADLLKIQIQSLLEKEPANLVIEG